MNEDEYIIRASKGLKLYMKEWHTEASPKAVVPIVHGLGEHCRRYDHVAEYFNKHQIGAFGYDHRGHGKSGGKRGHAGSIDLLLEDLELVIMKVRSLYNDIPFFLYGHSMGGNIVANYIIKKNNKELTGAIISSPWLGLTQKVPGSLLMAVKFLQKIVPSLTIGNGLSLDALSFDKGNIERYKKDPLVHDRISVRLFYQLYQSATYALEHSDKVKIPVLLGHGDHDDITSFESTKLFAERLGDRAQFKPWEKRKHEVHNDIGKEDVMAFYANWILSICSRNNISQSI